MCDVGPPASRRSSFTVPYSRFALNGIPSGGSLYCHVKNHASIMHHSCRENTRLNSRMTETVTRKGSSPIKVWVLPEEKRDIEANATMHGLSSSSFLRRVGLGMTAKSVLDQQAIIELAKVNGDLGRLGGLLKMWLTNDEKLAVYDRTQLNQTILGVLENIRTIQATLLDKAKKV